MTRLLLDVMLGKLATYLRMCGYDAAYALDRDAESDDAVLAWAREEDRTVVTRDEALAAAAPASILLSARDVVEQLAELHAAGLELSLPTEPTRCSQCNAWLVRVGPEEARPDYAPSADEAPVWRCEDCGQHYWRGSHWEDVERTLSDVDVA